VDDVELGPAWTDPDAEYRTLVDLLFPFVLAQFEGGLRDWDAADAKAVGLLAADGALLALLVAVHDVLNALWWLPALACVGAGCVLVASLALRVSNEGPYADDVHASLGVSEAEPLGAARKMVELLLAARRENEHATDVKLNLIQIAFVALAAAIVGSVPIALIRPG
jgi:hypothetical protein